MADTLASGAPQPQPSLFTQPPPPAQRAASTVGLYRTALPPLHEMQFQNWVKTNNIPFDNSPTSDYDMRGFYQAALSGDPNAQMTRSAFDGRMHFPDTWKTPYHATFSKESKYATPDAPHWEGNRLIDKTGRVVADERTSQERFLDDMRNYQKPR